MDDRGRRGFLTLGAGALAATAGCLDSLGSGGATTIDSGGEFDSVTGSFYTLADFTRNVAGDALDVENAVPMGQHGHGWEPQSDLTADIVQRGGFVHLGVEGFQRWADEVANEIESNHEGIALIPAAANVELLEYGSAGGHEGHDHGNESDGGHSHGDYDPHFWVDPQRAQQAVETIRDGLVAADDGNASTYEENAASYLDELAALDTRFEEGLSERERDVVVVASHNAYAYLADRYDFEIHTPQGVSPDQEPSPSEIAETVDLIGSEDIEYVLYDYFSGDTLARTVVEETNAQEARALSPAESIIEEWQSEGLDYIGQMETINLPALQAALGSE